MRKKYIAMLVITLVIGIVIGILSSGFFYKKNNRLIVAPNKDFYRQKIVRLLKPDETQLKQLDNPINNFSERIYTLQKDNNNKLYNVYDSLYKEIKPSLSQEQKDKFEKRLNHINAEISK